MRGVSLLSYNHTDADLRSDKGLGLANSASEVLVGQAAPGVQDVHMRAFPMQVARVESAIQRECCSDSGAKWIHSGVCCEIMERCRRLELSLTSGSLKLSSRVKVPLRKPHHPTSLSHKETATSCCLLRHQECVRGLLLCAFHAFFLRTLCPMEHQCVNITSGAKHTHPHNWSMRSNPQLRTLLICAD